MKKLVIGVDIGGINTVLGLVDRTGEVYARSSFRTAEYPFFRRLSGLCRNARTDAAGALCGDACRGCTVGYRDRCSECQLSYGPDRASGQSLEVSIRRAESGGRAAVFLALQGGRNSFPGIPVRITNDANAAALGEIAYGNAGGMRDFIMVTLGTGLGSGFVAGGRMIYGHDGMAGELGHVVVEPGGRQCGCGRVAVWKPMFLRRVPNGRPRVDGPGNGAERFYAMYLTTSSTPG